MGYRMTPYSMDPPTLFRRVWIGRNVALSNWKAYHYGENYSIPGRTYSSYDPPLSYPDPEATIAYRIL